MRMVIMFKSHLHDMTSIERYVGQSTISFFRYIAYTYVV